MSEHEHLSRSETLRLLRSLGVDLPADTKSSDKWLRNKLTQALNYAQLAPQKFSSSQIDFSNHMDYALKPLKSKIVQTNLYESVMDGLLDGSDQFACMRNAIGVMCDEWDMGYRKLSFEKEGKSCGILIRIISVVKSSKGGPSMILLFKSVNMEALKSAPEFRQWSRSSDGEQDTLRPHHSNSVLEQKLLYRLLSINAMRVADAYRPDRSDFEHDFTLSFLRPIGPLTMSDLGKLNAEAGCFICGSNDNHLRCTGCQSIIYCSKACQKEDWKRHKPLCNSLAGGTWTTLDFSPTNNLFTSQINRFHRSDQQLKIKKPNEGPPPNIHSDQPFLIKIQVNAFGSLVYDRARSFEWNVLSAEKPDTWAACHDMARTGFLGAKCYRWAKRESDWKLSICVDRVPDEMPKW